MKERNGTRNQQTLPPERISAIVLATDGFSATINTVWTITEEEEEECDSDKDVDEEGKKGRRKKKKKESEL